MKWREIQSYNSSVSIKKEVHGMAWTQVDEHFSLQWSHSEDDTEHVHGVELRSW